MDDILLVVISALISGLLATVVTIFWQRKSMKYESKKKVFETLMGLRFNIVDVESVKALNRVSIVFYRDEEVIKAFRNFITETNTPDQQHSDTGDKYLRLLEKMAKALKLENIDWETIKKYYYPVGLANKMQEEDMLRVAQINSYKKDTKENKQISPEQEMGMQVFLKAMENPGSFDKLMDFISKTNPKK